MFSKALTIALLVNSLLACLVYSPASAQETDPSSIAEGTATDLRITPRFSADFNTPRNGDDGNSFSRANAFFPLFQTPGSNLTFLSTSARLDSRGNLGGNVSLGHRLELDENTILGGYVAYDIRDSGNRTFNQIGLGAELFGNNWNAHLNGYIPVGTSSAQVGGVTSTNQVTDVFFQNNQLFLVTGGLQAFESALGSVDVGAGLKLGDFGSYGNLWGYGNAYYIADSLGGSLRLDHRLADSFRVGLGVQSDGIFGTQVFFSVGTSFGGTPRPTLFADEPDASGTPVTPWAQVAAADITRNSSIVVQQEMRGVPSQTFAAINPTTGQAYTFRHVNPTSTTPNQGDGSIANPFTTLGATSADAANTGLRNVVAGDVVYVQAGDSRTTNLTSFTIPAGVQVYSNAVAEILTTQLGNVALPGASTNNPRPLVNGGGADGITLTGGNNLIAGFEVNNSTNAINVTNPTGTVVVSNNLINNSTQRGVLFTQNAGTATADISGNTINNSTIDGMRFELTNAANLNLTIANNTINTVTDNAGDGIDLEANGTSTVALSITGNTITSARNSGLELETCGTNTIPVPTSCTSNFAGTVSGNTVTNSGGDGILFFHNSDQVGQLTISNNQVLQSGVNMTGVTTQAGALLPAGVTGNGGFGIVVGTFADGNLNLVIENNTITDSQDEKIVIANTVVTNTASGMTPAVPTLNVTIRNNQTSGTGVGILTGADVAVLNASGNLCLQLQNNTAAANGFFLANGVTVSSANPNPVAAAAIDAMIDMIPGITAGGIVLPTGTFAQDGSTGNTGTVLTNRMLTLPAPLNALGVLNVASTGATNGVCNIP